MEEYHEIEEEIHLRDYVRILGKRRNPILIFFLSVFTIVVIKTLATTPLYTASSKLMIEKVDAGSLISDFGVTRFDPEFRETQTQVIKSLTVALHVVDILNLDETLEQDRKKHGGVFAAILAPVKNALAWIRAILSGVPMESAAAEEIPIDPEQKRREEIAEMVQENIVVSAVPNSKIVDISYTCESPRLASMIANTVAKAYMDELLEMKMQASAEAIRWMRNKVDEEGAKLEASENRLQAYMKDKDIVTIEDRVTIIPQKLATLSSQLTQAETRRQGLEAVYRQLKTVGTDDAETIPIIADSDTIRQLRREINEAEQNIADLSKVYGSKYPEMIKARDNLAMLNKKRRLEIDRIKKTAENEYAIALNYENNIRDLLKETKEDAVKMNEKFIQYGMMKRDIESYRSIFDGLMKSLKEMTVTEKTSTANVYIVEKARPPEKPSSPHTGRNIILGFVLGLFGGFGMAFFLEYIDNTVKSPADIEEKTSLPVLGSFSLIKPEKDADAVSDNGSGNIAIIAEDGTSYAESYKSLRTAILLSSGEKPPKTVVVTSTAPGEGKSTVASNLAITIAKTGRNVLLVDCDMRRPRLHKIFDLDNRAGFSSLLAGASNNANFLKTEFSHLRVVPSGPIPPDPAELLASARLKSFINTCNSNFDFIVFDSPPVLAISDSLLLTRHVDGVIFVTLFGKTTFEGLEKGVKSIREVNGRILGAVINGVNVNKNSYYYKYAFNYDYYYKSDD